MKKITLFAIALLASVVSFAALNPYAYGLSSSLSADETTLTINYSLNAPATAVSVVIMDGENAVKTIDCNDKKTKGSHSVDVSTLDLPTGKSLTWKVDVKGAAVTKATAVSTYRFYHPSSVDIDNNPESAHFGRLLCIEASHYIKTASRDNTFLAKGFGAGIFAFNAAFDPIKNGELAGFNGGNEFTTTHYAIRRVRISDDGRIFVTAQNDGGCFLWEVNPDNLNSWTKVFEGTASTYTTTTSDGKFIAGTNSGFDVHGSGENLKLLMLSAAKSGPNISTFRCDEYDLGTKTKWSTVPSRSLNKGYHYVTNQSNAQYDAEGGVWHIQYRSGVEETHPGLVHINKDGVEDFKEYWTNARNAGFCFNSDYSKVIIAGKFDDSHVGTQKYATIYMVSKNSEGKPVLTKELEVDMTNIGASLNDFAWDYADNIYAVDNGGEYLCAYALPHTADKVVSTPCASKYAFQLQDNVQGTFYTLTTNVDATMGKVTGNEGQYLEGTEATITAVAHRGHKFLNWTVGEETKTENPLTLTVNSNLTVTANFEALPAYTINATANDGAMGTIIGAGTYYKGETVTLKATANTGHAFVDWSNGATEPTLTFTATKDSTVQANFKVLSYTVALATNDEAKGFVAGAGTYDYGTEVELTATPAEGYELLYWSDRSTDNPRTITVNGNKALSAYFVKEYTQEPTFTIEKLWENAQVPAATADGYQAVGWDGKIYMQNKTVGKIQVFSNGTDAAVDYATSGTGQQIAIDEAGNLIVFNASFATSTPNNILIYAKGSTEGKAVSFTLSNPGQCHFFTASGDIYSAEGGYVYFYCQNTTVVNRVKIANGAATAEDVTVDVVGNNITAGNTQNHVMVDIFGNLVAHSRSNAASWINVHTNESSKTFAATLAGIKLSTLGGCTFELGGKELWAYNVGTTNYNSEWNIYNMTDDTFLSDTVFYAIDKVATTNYACNWLNVQKVDEQTAYIYQFCPKKGVAAWKVTCDTGEEPENPTVLDNTVVAPQVEKIVRDGQVLIIRDGKTFNMMGQEVR